MNNIILVLTHHCNYKCPHCYDKIKNNLLTDVQILNSAKKILKNLKKNKIYNIIISGGECTLFPYLEDVVKYAKKLKINVSLFSNGSKDLDTFIPYIDKLNISLDGNKFIHNKIRGVDFAYDNVFSHIQKLYNSEVLVNVQCTISKLNIDNLSFIEEVSDAINIEKDSIFVESMISTSSKDTNDLMLSQAEEEKVYKYIINLLEKKNYHLNINSNIKKIETDIEFVDFNYPVFIDVANNQYYIDLKFSKFEIKNSKINFKKVREELERFYKKFKEKTHENIENIEENLLKK